MQHPGVHKAAPGVADARLGEKVCLAAIPAPGKSTTAPALLEHRYGAGLSKYDIPETLPQLDAFPLTAGGQILVRERAEWARAGRIRPEPGRWSEAGD
jgi:acyl-CoA synthetase